MTDERTPLSTIAELQKHCPRQGAVLRASDRSDRSDGLDEHGASAAAADPRTQPLIAATGAIIHHGGGWPSTGPRPTITSFPRANLHWHLDQFARRTL